MVRNKAELLSITGFLLFLLLPRYASPLVQFDPKRAFEHVKVLADRIGPRIAGTVGERKAGDYIASTFAKFGYDVRFQGPIVLNPVKRHTWNIIARRKHNVCKHRFRIVVGAHYDSTFKDRGSPGANDNASGVAIILEVARVLANVEFPFEIEFVAFGGEESVDGNLNHHHYGSRFYVQQYLANRLKELRIVGMISVDMIGVGSEFYARTLGLADPYLVNKVLKSSRELGIPMRKKVGGPWSDHEPFEKVGIPSVWIHRRPDPNYHTRDDRPEKVRLPHLRDTGLVLLHTLLSLTEEDLNMMAQETGGGASR